ncbi:MAG: YkgJ family cysteine cluster protein [Methanospirillum sp.]|nr:YkgJ family cysteine cluster protein [Methanospirillum sp.]
MAVSFVCTSCGRCCSSLGRSISIVRRVTGRHFDCQEAVRHESFRAEIADEYRGSVPSGEACPFLVRTALDEAICACYQTRPRLCREYRCASMRVFDSGGVERGHVGGRRSLLSDDPILVALWDSGDGENDATWRKRMDAAITAVGYRADWYD